MRKIILFIILVIAFSSTKAQPNPGFEDWHNEFSYLVPDGWQTYNFMMLNNPPNPQSAFRVGGVDKHSGNYALKLKSVYFNNNPFPSEISDTAGGAFTGHVTISPFSFQYGFPYAGRPEKLTFWSKYTPVGNDSAGMIVILKKWIGTQPDTVGIGVAIITATSGYTLFQVNMIYQSPELPDSAAIFFGSSRVPDQARQGSALYIDDLEFSGWIGVDQHQPYSDKVKVFPNPAKDNITFQAEIKEAEHVRIIDVQGKPAGVFKIENNNAKVNTSLFSAGVYFYEIRNKDEKILANGKFNVVK